MYISKIPLSFGFWISLLFFGAIIRFILSLTKAIECKFGGLDVDKKEKDVDYKSKYGFWKALAESFLTNADDDKLNDYSLPFFIGLCELICLPVIMCSNKYEVIGVWIGIKTLAQWERWSSSRTTFNRFILGNLLVLIASACLYISFFNE